MSDYNTTSGCLMTFLEVTRLLYDEDSNVMYTVVCFHVWRRDSGCFGIQKVLFQALRFGVHAETDCNYVQGIFCEHLIV